MKLNCFILNDNYCQSLDPVLPIPNLEEIYGKTILKNEKTDEPEEETNIRSRYPTLDLMTMESVRENNIEFSTVLPDIINTTLSTTMTISSLSTNTN